MHDLYPGIHPSVRIDPTARIKVDGELVIGEGGVIGENCVIQGRDIVIGQELWMDAGATIGGGSCFERQSRLRAGHFLHMGRDSFINTARPVTIGNEVGLGMRTSIFTHGAYLSALDGFPVSFAPVSIGNRVWLPQATVNPGVTIGDDVVVAAGSVIARDVPAGALAGGVPARVLREHVYPARLASEALDDFWDDFFEHYPSLWPRDIQTYAGQGLLVVGGKTDFYIHMQRIVGPVTDEAETLRNQLRRYGIRFYSRPVDGSYETWA
jgi:acetyltransferase-like isoleucine patch superfamily enzyme